MFLDSSTSIDCNGFNIPIFWGTPTSELVGLSGKPCAGHQLLMYNCSHWFYQFPFLSMFNLLQAMFFSPGYLPYAQNFPGDTMPPRPEASPGEDGEDGETAGVD